MDEIKGLRKSLIKSYFFRSPFLFAFMRPFLINNAKDEKCKKINSVFDQQ